VVALGAIDSGSVLVELYADPVANDAGVRAPMERRESLPGLPNGYRYEVELRTSRPLWHFTARVIPRREGVSVPTETPLIAWGRR
jgi:starch phosphorylase